jgi:hypothetical protein
MLCLLQPVLPVCPAEHLGKPLGDVYSTGESGANATSVTSMKYTRRPMVLHIGYTGGGSFQPAVNQPGLRPEVAGRSSSLIARWTARATLPAISITNIGNR